MSENKVQDVKGVGVLEINPKDFAERYQALVEETGYQVVAQPIWVATNHGTFEMTIQLTIGKTKQDGTTQN